MKELLFTLFIFFSLLSTDILPQLRSLITQPVDIIAAICVYRNKLRYTQLIPPRCTLSSSKEGSQLRAPRVNDPRTFNGSNHDGDGYNRLENFITQLKMVFILQPSRFPNEATKVMYAASFMDGMAFEWIQPYINNIGTAKEDPIATNFEQFTAAIRRMFGDVTLLSDAENKVMKMKPRAWWNFLICKNHILVK